MSLDRFVLTIENQLLFHGSGIPNIKVFRPALDKTFGEGLYLTSDRDRAESYGIFRTVTEYGGEFEPASDTPVPQTFEATCYKFEVNGRYLDLRTEKAMKAILPLWQEYLRDDKDNILTKYKIEVEKMDIHDDWKELLVKGMDEQIEKIINNKSEKINRNSFLEPNSYLNTIFTEYLQSQGFDGLVAIEGTDKQGDLTTLPGNSWVVFEPTQARLVKEYKVEQVS